MCEKSQLRKQWIEELFEDSFFIEKLTQFIAQKPDKSNSSLEEKMQAQINAISSEISTMIITATQKQSELRFDIVAEQLTKLSAQISNIKNTVFSGQEKIDLQTTDHNKSKLEISSILEHDLAYDFGEVKQSILEMQQRFNEWFGGKISGQQFSAGDALSESKISQFISKKCAEQVQSTEKKMMKRLQTTDLLTERRFEQVTKTMNNVLEMLNEAHSKKNEKIQAEEIEQIRTPSTNQPSMIRQSSLQSLKIKSFFNFGHK